MKKNFLKTAVAAFGLALLVAGTAELTSFVSFAAGTGTTIGATNVRSDASASSSLVTSLGAGASVTLGDSKTNDAGETWYAVTTSDGKTGYIRADLMNISADTGTNTTTTDGGDGTNTAEGTDTTADVPTAQGEGYAASMTPTNATVNEDVHVRSGAGTSYTQIGDLAGGTAIVVFGQAKDSAGDVWYQFYSTGTDQQLIGFVRNDYITLGDPLEQTTTTETTENASTAETTPDYEAVFADDGTGTSVWYLYNNKTQKREKISDIDDALQNANTLAATSQASAKKFKTFALILGILLIIAIALVVYLIIRLLREQNEGGEVDLMRERKREEKRLERGSSAGTGYGTRDAARRRPEDGRGDSRTARPAGTAVRSTRDGRPAGDRAPYATRRTPADTERRGSRPTDGADRRPVRTPEGAADTREARPAGTRESSGTGAPRPSVRPGEERTGVRPAAQQPVQKRETGKPAQNFAGVDDDDDFQFIDIDDDNRS